MSLKLKMNTIGYDFTTGALERIKVGIQIPLKWIGIITIGLLLFITWYIYYLFALAEAKRNNQQTRYDNLQITQKIILAIIGLSVISAILFMFNSNHRQQQ